MVHKWLLERSSFEDDYTVSLAETPKSAQQTNFCKTYSDLSHINDPERAILAYKSSYVLTSDIEKRAMNLVERYKDYLNQDRSKIIVSEQEIARLMEIEHNCRRHKLANDLLFNGTGFNEVQVLFKHKAPSIDMSIPCKSMLDRVTLTQGSDIEKSCARIIDIKTCSCSIGEFIKSKVWEYEYPRQLAFYRLALNNNVFECPNEDFKNTLESLRSGDIVYDHNIIAIACSQSQLDIEVIQLSQDLIQHELNKIKPILDRIAWHWATNQWAHYKEYYDGAPIKLDYVKD
jgi:hypothetical protein